MFLARELAVSSHAAIGDYFGGRDLATVRHECAADHYLAATLAASGGRWHETNHQAPRD